MRPILNAPRPCEPGVLRDVAVLVADDLPILRAAAQSLLEAVCGTPPEVVENGYDAVASVLAGRYDLVLMDLQMPVMDGVAATKLIRLFEAAAPERSRTPIVAYSTVGPNFPLKGLIASGFDDVLCKPATTQQMQACIDRWCLPPSENNHQRTVRFDSAITAIVKADTFGVVVASLLGLQCTTLTMAERDRVAAATTLAQDRLSAVPQGRL